MAFALQNNYGDQLKDMKKSDKYFFQKRKNF
jgi:hypothetical protein